MASLTTTEKILIAVLNQTRKEDGTYPTPDYDNLNRVLGLQSREAARLRWHRLTQKIRQGEFESLTITKASPGDKHPDDEPQKSPKKRKATKPKHNKKMMEREDSGGDIQMEAEDEA